MITFLQVVKHLILAGANIALLNRSVYSDPPVFHIFTKLELFLPSNNTHNVCDHSHERSPIDEAVSRGKMDVIDAINEAAAQVELSTAQVS